MDESMSRQRSDADKMVSFDPVVAPGVDDIFGALDYRLSADYDMEWAPNEGGASPRYDAVVRLETRPPQAPQLQQPEMPIFEGNDKWLELLLRACAPPKAKAMPDGGAAVIAAITAAARHAGVTNPIDAMRAVIAQRRQKELQAVERAEEAQDQKRKDAAERRVATRTAKAAAARAAGLQIPPLPRRGAPAAAAAKPEPGAVAAGSAGGSAAAGAATAGAAAPPAAARLPPQRSPMHRPRLPFIAVPAAPPGTAREAAARAAALATALFERRAAQPGSDALAATTQHQLPPVAVLPAAAPVAAPAGNGGASSSKACGSGSKRSAESAAAGDAAAGRPDAGANGSVAGTGAAADVMEGVGAAVRPAKRQRQSDEPKRTWMVQVSLFDDVSGLPIHFKADGWRFKNAKAPASLKFAFNRFYKVRLTVDDSLAIGANAHLVSRSPTYFEDPTDQADAHPFFQDDAVRLARIDPAAAAAAPVTGGAAAGTAAGGSAAAAAATPAAAKPPAAKPAAAGGSAAAPAAAAAATAAAVLPAQPAQKAQAAAAETAGGAAAASAVSKKPAAPPEAPTQPAAAVAAAQQSSTPAGRVTWEGRWRNLAEPTKKTQRAALWLNLRFEGLGTIELPLMSKALQHVTFTIERNPFSELLEVSGAAYSAAAPAKA